MAEGPPHLRVLIADEDQSRVAEIANIVSGLRHSIVAQLLDGSDQRSPLRRRVSTPTWRPSG